MFVRLMATVSLCLFLGSMSYAQQPPSLYALTHIKNDSAVKTTTFYRWGSNGQWKKIIIEPGKSMAFPFAYDGDKKSSPDLYVRIDTQTDNDTKYVEHLLSRGQSPDDNAAQYGHTFSVQQVKGTDTRYIAAVTKGAVVKVTDAKSTKPEVK